MIQSTNISLQPKPKAEIWFGSGKRVLYNFHKKEVLKQAKGSYHTETTVRVWHKVVNQNNLRDNSEWTIMLPGFPDGSFGWAPTERHLSALDNAPRLYVEYIGMGDSDKPKGYKYGVNERADMIEALWKQYKIKTAQLITFDFSSLVALELLSRQIDRDRLGVSHHTIINKVLFINGGLFADSHSHPLLTTPLLKTAIGRIGAKKAQSSSFLFNLMMKDLWSKEYGVTQEELAENHKAISRRGGTIFLSDAAGFVDEHKLNADRWDLKKVFKATYPSVKYIVAGSEQDQFEHKQIKKAQKELQHLGLEIEIYPGGHMTTSEYPERIATTIEKLKSIN